MNNVLIATLMLGAAVTAVAQNAKPGELSVVPNVDLKRYAGTWYEVARLPNTFQARCAEDVTATYTLRDDGSFDVVNKCRQSGGCVNEAAGRAKLADANGPASKLKVRFAPGWLSFLPFVWGNYWIIDLAPDYSYAVIGEPGRKYLWVLSRTPQFDEVRLDSILAGVKKQGYDLTNLIRTTQTEK
jgi:apolipoprotein D and lipocalin family protein